MARRVKPTLLTAIIAVLLLHFETGLQHYFLSSYSLETLFNCIHKIARIIKRKHIQSASSPNIFECGALLNLHPLSSSELNLKVKTASYRRYVNKHLEKCSAQQHIDHSENRASPAGVSRGARIYSLPEEILGCEQQTYFRSSLPSLRKIKKRRPEIRLLFAGNPRRRF